MSDLWDRELPRASELATEVAGLDGTQFNFFLLRLTEKLEAKKKQPGSDYNDVSLSHVMIRDLLRELQPELLHRPGQK